MWKKIGNIFNECHAQVPVIDTTNDGFWRVYYSTRVEGKSVPMYFDVIAGEPEKIIYNHLTPILELGEYGTFDQAGIMPTDIITLESGVKYLYYIGWTNRLDVPYHNTIGLAISNNGGKTFKKFSTGPILGTSHREPGFVGTISVMKNGNKWLGWYLSCIKWEKINNKLESFYNIKLALSNNGIDWEPTGHICIPLKENEGGLSQASVIKENNIFKMWFSYRGFLNYRNNKKNSYRIGYAESIDGKSWERKEGPELNISPEGWDSEMVCYPYIFTYNKNKYMFYNGNGFGKTGIGYAINR